MNLRYVALFASLVCCSLCGCRPDTVAPTEGSLQVFVASRYGQASGVSISLEPGDTSGLTNEFGVFTVPKLPARDYTVIAEHPELGRDTALAPVHENETTQVNMHLPGSSDTLDDQRQKVYADWIIPDEDFPFATRQQAWHQLVASVWGEDDPPGTLRYRVVSDLDGELFSGIDSAGLMVRYRPPLTEGRHVLTLTVSNSRGDSATSDAPLTILPPFPKVQLTASPTEAGELRISWAEWPWEDFGKYRLLRRQAGEEGAIPLAEFDTRGDTSFVDRTVYFNREVTYILQVFEVSPYDPLLVESLITSLPVPHIALESPVVRLLADPARHRLYGVDRENDRVVVVDTETRAIIAYIPVGSKPEDLALSPDGALLYVANSGSDLVSVVDPERLMATRELPLPLTKNGSKVLPRRLASLSDGRLAVVSSADAAGLYLYRPGFDTLSYLGSTEVGDQILAASANGTILFGIESSDAPTVNKFITSAEGNLVLAQTSKPSADASRIVLTSNGNYLFFGGQKLDAGDIERVVEELGADSDSEVFLASEDGGTVMIQEFYYRSLRDAPIAPIRASMDLIAYDALRNLSYHLRANGTIITQLPLP